jgi:hypothetical protein
MAGLGATPEAAQMMAPPAMEEPQAMAPQPMEQAMGMAAGGLADLPVPESMFDEPNNGGYAGGGIVAFAQGEEVKAKKPDVQQMLADLGDEAKGRAEYEALYRPKREYAERANQYNKDLLSEEGQKKRYNQDLGAFLMDFGANWASTPGDFFSSAGQSFKAAAPGLQESRKERRAEMRDALKQMAADEGMTNAEQREFLKHMMGRKDKYAELVIGEAARQAAENMELKKLESGEKLGYAQIAAQDRASRATAAARNKPDFMQNAVATRFSALKEANAMRPPLKPGEKFNRNLHRLSDATLANLAYQQVMGQRYFDPATNPLTQNKAAAIEQFLNPNGSGAGQDTVDLGPIDRPQG